MSKSAARHVSSFYSVAKNITPSNKKKKEKKENTFEGSSSSPLASSLPFTFLKINIPRRKKLREAPLSLFTAPILSSVFLCLLLGMLFFCSVSSSLWEFFWAAPRPFLLIRFRVASFMKAIFEPWRDSAILNRASRKAKFWESALC